MGVKNIISGTFILILVYLLVINHRGATSIISQVGSTYSKAVMTLQGR